MLTSVAIVNCSSLPMDEVNAFARAMNRQVLDHLAPAWQRYATIWARPHDGVDGIDTWKVELYDEPLKPEDAGAYGYHKPGKPGGVVFVRYAERNNFPWTVAASHEINELLINPWLNDYVVRAMPDGSTQLWPKEPCDPVEDQSYHLDDIELSNFVLPAYFVEGAPGPYDFLGELTAPFQVAAGGYSAIRIINPGGLTGETLYGAAYPSYRKEIRPGSRVGAMAALTRSL